MSGFQRPHCQNRDACVSKSPVAHCGSCAAKGKYADPAARKKTSEAKRASFKRNPDILAKVAASGVVNLTKGRQGVDFGAIRRRADAARTPEERSAMWGRKGLKAGLSGADLELYVSLCRQGFLAKEARRMVEEQIRASVRRVKSDMLAKQARQRREAY